MDTAAHPDPDRVVTLAGAGDLIAALPPLMGFHPANSVLLVTLKGATVRLTVRADLAPPPLYSAMISSLLRPVRQAEVDAAMLLIVRSEPHPAHEDLVRRLVAAVAEIGVPVLHAVWTPATTAGVPWRCYLHKDCGGHVPEPSDSDCAAAMALAGEVPLGSRDDLVRLLDPPDRERVSRLSGLLDVASRSDRTSGPEHLATVRAAVTAGTLPATDEEFVRLAMALSDYRVRDACLGYTLDGTLNRAAQKLWLELARSLPPPERAEAASLLAASAYVHGDGALANVALERARAALPDHNLTHLLGEAIGYGIPTRQICQVLSDAAADAEIDLAEEADMSP